MRLLSKSLCLCFLSPYLMHHFIDEVVFQMFQIASFVSNFCQRDDSFVGLLVNQHLGFKNVKCLVGLPFFTKTFYLSITKQLIETFGNELNGFLYIFIIPHNVIFSFMSYKTPTEFYLRITTSLKITASNQLQQQKSIMQILDKEIKVFTVHLIFGDMVL